MSGQINRIILRTQKEAKCPRYCLQSALAFSPSFVLSYLVSFRNGRGAFISNKFLPLSDRRGIHNASFAADEQPYPYPFYLGGFTLSSGRVAPKR
jgi:hypothetical protein